MSAAATAAGYLYASGRLRGRNSREGAENERPQRNERSEHRRHANHEAEHEVKVAVYAPELQAEKPVRKTPKIQYRVRRWRPSENE
jgi:hypothetical protein